ncbi:DNA alkylation repair protein [Viscerimonas tarda]
MTTEDAIRDLRKRCRLSMDGATAANMRSHGLNYKLNFGVSLQKIKEIARRYTPGKELAEALWKEDVRELKIFASLLFPVSEFSKDEANTWLSGVTNQEIREQVCINLFQHLPFAEELAYEWCNNAEETVRITGYWLLVRLLIAKNLDNEINTGQFACLFDDAGQENLSLRNSAQLALKHIGRASKENATAILSKVEAYKNSPDSLKKELYDNLNFEFEYYYER